MFNEKTNEQRLKEFENSLLWGSPVSVYQLNK